MAKQGKKVRKEKKEEKPENRQKKKYLGLLITLIVIILLVDGVAFLLYNYNNKVGGEHSTSSMKCSDGTSYGDCSKNNPYYCYEGELVQKAETCGCPLGYVIDFQSCKK